MEMGKKIKLQLEEKNKYANTSSLNGSGGSNCGGGDNQSDPYVRKSDLADFVRKGDLADFVKKEDLKNFVTKSELRDELNLLRKDMVTKSDLTEALSNFVTKADLKEELKNFATKEELKALEIKMDNGFAHLEKLILNIRN
jgi:hypothetical protein